ncbi:MAG: glycoside hydrolase family 43 protein [Tepidisphaeraceae bacterium]
MTAPAIAADAENPWPNPLIKQRADPFIVKHTDGYYYFTASVPEYDRIELRRAKTIDGLASATPKVVWRKHNKGPMGNHIWAPEMHYIDGSWYVYFAAGGAEDKWAIRIYVIKTSAENPLDGPWEELGQFKTGWESFALDSTTFVHNGQRYFAWAQHTPDRKDNTDLYIAKLKSPMELDGKPVRISKPELPWERQGFAVNEGPAFIAHGDKVFLTYSASATDARYCMGLLTADAKADLLDPNSWKKSDKPVFATSEANKIFGPGHNSFTVDEAGGDVIVYHARSYKEIKGDPLYDHNRQTRVQRITWSPDGMPVFGDPRPDTK